MSWPLFVVATLGAFIFICTMGAVGCFTIETKEQREHRRNAGSHPGAHSPAPNSSFFARFPPGTAASGTRPRVVEDPVRAWKRAHVHPITGQFIGVGMGVRYSAEGYAICPRAESPFHTENIPMETCTCGFYAVKERPGDRFHETVVLEVELFGKIIVADYGYRAQYQRVLAVYSPRDLYRCTASTGHYQSRVTGQNVRDYCREPGVAAFAVSADVNWAPYEIFCAYHAKRRMMMSPQEVRAVVPVPTYPDHPDVGTEWHWV